MQVFRTLIDAATLGGLLGQPGLRIVDCRHDLGEPAAGRRAYSDAHLPGAVFMHLDEDLSGACTGCNGRHPLPDRAAFAARLGALGIGPEDQVVAYDDAGGAIAARLWWMLRWIGHERAAVLEGGLRAWRTADLPLESAVPTLTAVTHHVRPPLVRTVEAPELQEGIARNSLTLIDARSPDRFAGENETLDPVAGHIPGALNRFFRNNLTDGRFRPAGELRAGFEALLAGRAPVDVVHQCGSGVTACHNLLAMEVAGLHGARLYPGSWSEWCADPARPVATGDT
ncbi:MAG: sulfurtransferase [Zoogloeaceae bacterium]|nr:sulfurtransferase [Zoogloeaceae bacterium]